MASHRVTRVLAVVLVTGLLAAGCSDDNDDPTGADGPPSTPETVHAVSQNILHGEACPADSDKCDLPGRVAFFVEQLGESCPDLVGLQETNQRILDELEKGVADICDGTYEVVWDDDPSTDREAVLTDAPRARAATLPSGRAAAHRAVGAGLHRRRGGRLLDHPPGERLRQPPVRRGHLPAAVPDRGRPQHLPGPPGGRARQRPPGAGRGADRRRRPQRRAGQPDHLGDAGHGPHRHAPRRGQRRSATPRPPGVSCTGGRDDTSIEGLSDPDAQQSERIDYLLLRRRRHPLRGRRPDRPVRGRGRRPAARRPRPPLGPHRRARRRSAAETTEESGRPAPTRPPRRPPPRPFPRGRSTRPPRKR